MICFYFLFSGSIWQEVFGEQQWRFLNRCTISEGRRDPGSFLFCIHVRWRMKCDWRIYTLETRKWREGRCEQTKMISLSSFVCMSTRRTDPQCSIVDINGVVSSAMQFCYQKLYFSRRRIAFSKSKKQAIPTKAAQHSFGVGAYFDRHDEMLVPLCASLAFFEAEINPPPPFFVFAGTTIRTVPFYFGHKNA